MKWQNKITDLELNPNDTLPDLLVSSLDSWKTIVVTGADQKSYLQGQLTCDLVKLAPDESTLGAHCDAKGKVWSIFRCFKHNDGYALFHHGSTIDTSLKEIQKYSVFSKVEMTISQDVALGIIGKSATAFIDNLTENRGNVRPILGGTAIKIDENRWLLLITGSSVEELFTTDANSTVEPVFTNDTVWDKFDIENGIPRIVEAVQNSQIPQAFNLQAIDGISFHKGCYTGQETVARARYRGTNKRAMYIVKGHTEALEETPMELERSVGENWRSVGQLFANYRYADGTTIGLIILPNDLDADTILRQKNPPNTHWNIEPVPYVVDDK